MTDARATLRLYMGEPFSQIVSLGNSCATKYQISLSIIKRLAPSISYEEMKQHIFGNRNGILVHGTHYFDWLITPYSGLIKTVESDFTNAFRIENLSVTEDGGSVRDAHSGILYHHNFSRKDGRISQETVLVEYEEQACKVEYLKRKFLGLLESRNRILYVILMGPHFDSYNELVSVLRRRSANPNFHVLFLKRGEPSFRHTINEALFSAIGLTSENRKPREQQWSGDDGYWGEILDRIPYVPREELPSLAGAPKD
jgi:hypothetical protein